MKASGEIPWLPDKFVVLRGGAPVLHTLLLLTRDHVRLRFYLGNQDIPRDCVRSSHRDHRKAARLATLLQSGRIFRKFT